MAGMEKRHKISEELRGETSAISNWIFFCPDSGAAHFFTLFGMLFSAVSVILPSFPEASKCVAQLCAVACAASAIFFAEYLPRLYCAPAARPGAPAWRARFGCALSETSRAVIFPHIFIVFKPVRYLSPLRLTGEVFGGAKEEGAAARAAFPPIVCFFATFIYFLERSFNFGGFENIGGGFSSGRIFGLSHVEIAMAALSAAIAGSAFIGAMQNAMKMENPQNR